MGPKGNKRQPSYCEIESEGLNAVVDQVGCRTIASNCKGTVEVVFGPVLSERLGAQVAS